MSSTPFFSTSSLDAPWSFGNAPRARALLSFRLSEIHRTQPRELDLKTGRVLTALAAASEGLTRDEIVRFIFPHFPVVSLQYRESLIESTNKLIQRARLRFKRHGILIRFNRTSGRFVAEVIAEDGGKGMPRTIPCLTLQFVHGCACNNRDLS